MSTAQVCKDIYESKIETLHLATLFKQHLLERLSWVDPVLTTSYFSHLKTANELVDADMLKAEPLEGLFDIYLTRVTQKGRKNGYSFRIIHFPEYKVAYLSAYDYVGDELNILAAESVERIKPFFDAVKERYKVYINRENQGKLTIYTLENGNPATHLVPMPAVTEKDIVVDGTLLKDINDDLKSFFENNTELYQHFDIAHRRGIMFHGPPGCGKTLMCKYVAHRAKVPVVQFFASAAADTSDLLNFFEYMADITPAIVIFEDLDSLFKGDLARSNFLNILDGACTNKKLSLLILATTNHIKEIDEALTQRPSRFDRHYFFGFPDEGKRREYVLRRFSSVKSMVDDEAVIAAFVKNTKDMSYAHLNEIYTQAARKAIAAGKRTLSLPLIQEAIKNVKEETGNDKGKMSFKTTPLVPLKGDGNYIDTNGDDE